MSPRDLLSSPSLQLPAIALLAPLLFLHSCGTSWEESQREREQEKLALAREEQARADRTRLEDELRRAEAETARIERELAAKQKAEADLGVAQHMKPWERTSAITACVKGGPCPVDEETLVQGATSDAERSQLSRRLDSLVRARDRASAPLLCADGTTSPSCTCGAPRRGCCSHHGGVVGCSAD